MSHRPYIKNDDSGNISDLAIDAETLQGYKPCVNIVTLEDNNSTKAGTWLAKTNKVSALVDGQLFLYKITVAGASTTTLNITGSGGSLGAKTVYRTGTTKLTTQYAVGHYILLAYNSLNTCFRVVNDYDANSYAYVRQYQHGQNAAGATNLYPILTRYNLTNKNGTYDNAYARFHTDTYIDATNGYLYAPKVYSGGSEVAVKTDIPAEVTETTVSGWGFTKNTGTVTSVRVQAGTGLSSSTSTAQTGTLNTTISIASGYKLLTNSEYSYLNVNPDWNATTGLARILNKPDILPIINYTGNSPVELYNLSKGRYINATENDIALRNYAGGGMLPSVRWHPGEILTVTDNLHSWVLGTNYTTGEYYIFSGRADSTLGLSEYRVSSVADIANIPSSIGLGGPSTPLYIEVVTNEQGKKQNTFKECKSYGGGTCILKLNGYDTIGKSYDSIFAPETAGEEGQILKSKGYGAPVWETVTIPTKASWNYDDVYVKYTAAQSLTDAQKTQARSNIGAGTSSFTGYTDTNKLSTDYINNKAGWTSNTGTITSVRVQAGTGLSSSTSTAQTSILDTTISIADGYKLLTTTEYNTLNAKQNKISALGSRTRPVYFSNDGVANACADYAGGTRVFLNGTSNSGKDARMYAPTTAGTSGYSLKSNGSGAPRWANEAAVQVSGTINSGAKNNASITLVITDSSKPLKKGVWRYSGTHGVFLIFATTEITTMGSPRTAHICGYVSSQITNNTSLTLVEV